MIQQCLLPRTQSPACPHPGNIDDFLRVLIYSDLDDVDELGELEQDLVVLLHLPGLLFPLPYEYLLCKSHQSF